MGRKVLIGSAATLAILGAAVALQPAGYTVSRSTTIMAAPAKVRALLGDPSRWADWSPWAAAGRTAGESGIAGMELMPGDRSAVTGFRVALRDERTGAGEMLLTLEPEGRGTLVTWAAHGTSGFLGKAKRLVWSMDRMLGGHFEAGLEAIARLVERPVPEPED